MLVIRLAKKIKSVLKNEIKALTPVYISPVRRISGVKTSQRICAMTFDDGPVMQAPNPVNYDGPLTLCLLETLEKHGAKGTFDCIGDTSENYPDVCGKLGTAQWGGIAFDHYPQFGKDELAGAKNCPQLIDRILSGGHEISSHTYVHRIWGKKPWIYGERKYMDGIDDVIEDLRRFHSLMKEEHNYEPKLSRPPHYVDNIEGGFSSYDAYAVMGYQYMAAGPDGGGWLSGSSYEEEVEAMVKAIAEPLEKDSDAFCGAIIFQKDGCNMQLRTPVADALDKQLEILDKYGYRVVTVSELMAVSQFEDLRPEDELYPYAASMLEKGMCPAFSDNCIHAERPVSGEGEIAMMLFGWDAVRLKVAEKHSRGNNYDYAKIVAEMKGFDLSSLGGCKNRAELIRKLSEL